MDHTIAAKSQAVERYILGEMSPDERDAFEEHYFACTECAADVRAAAQLRANAREVLSQPNALAEDHRRRFPWWDVRSLVPITASLVLLAVVVFQSRQAGAPIAAVPYSIKETTRAAGDIRRIPAATRVFALTFDLPPVGDKAAPTRVYECRILDARGEIVATPSVQATERAESLTVVLNRSHLAAGEYTITVRDPGGPAQATIPEYKFILE
jgi:anti-sigma factor RsiW